MKPFLIIIGLVILFSGCVDNTVYFDKPQPEGIKDLDNLPFGYRGKYISADSAILTIDKKMIIRQHQYELIFLKSDIDTNRNLYIKNNMLIDRSTNEHKLIKVINDSIYVKGTQIDTIFNLSNNNIARKFKGNLILNVKIDNSWRVEILSLKWRKLKHSMINSKELFNKLALVSESEVVMDSSMTDTIRMILKPSRKEFKEILSLKDSLLIDVYKKIK